MRKKILFICLLITPSLYASESGLDNNGNPIPLRHYNVAKDDILSDNVAEKDLSIWNRFTRVIPAKYRPEIQEFEPIDGNSGIDGSVHAVSDDKSIWVVQLDTHDSVSKSDLDRTMIHEFAHLLTLRVNQVPFSKAAEDDVKASCKTYYLADGCTTQDSYLNAFVAQFWQSHLPAQSNEKAIAKRYKNYQSEFVSDYAATNPAEDIAESFSEYVLAEELPTPTSIANRKISFFADYPQLRELKQAIRTGLVSN